MSGKAYLRGLALGQRSSEETSQRWRAVGDTVSDLACPGIEPVTSRTDSDGPVFPKVWLEEPLRNFERPPIIKFVLQMKLQSTTVLTLTKNFKIPLVNFERPFRFLKTP